MSTKKTSPRIPAPIAPTRSDQLRVAKVQQDNKLGLLGQLKRVTAANILKRARGEDDKCTIENLITHLQIAMTLELSTIPPYFCAFYSIQTGDATQPDNQAIYGDNAETALIIRSVMMEEMLHLTLVGNILNAVGGKPMVNKEAFVPKYPTILPHSEGDFVVSLRKFDKDALRTFMRIEEPTPADAKPTLEGYATIGQFYEGINSLMRALENKANKTGTSIFNKKDTSLQVDEKYYYGAGNESVKSVTDLASAQEAIKIIMEQGEGSETSLYEEKPSHNGEIRELAHYFKFKEIYLEQRYAPSQKDSKEAPQGPYMNIKYDRVYNMGTDLKTKDYKDSPELVRLSNQFNLQYRELLDDLQAAFCGEQERLIKGVARMYKLRDLATTLMQNPVPGSIVNAGPTFEFLDDEAVKALKKELDTLA